ncbi:hypothetical protein ACFX2J_019596 [Malus domestica]
MKLLLESNGILGFVNDTHPCPARLSSQSGDSDVNSANSSFSSDSDEYLIWMMHDKALMQLLTASLSLFVPYLTNPETTEHRPTLYCQGPRRVPLRPGGQSLLDTCQD